MTGFLALVEFYARATTRSRIGWLSYGLGPLSFLFLITVVSGGKLLPTAVAGSIIVFAVDRGLVDLPVELSGLRTRSRFYDILVSLPLSPLTLVAGLTIGMSILSLPYLAVMAGALLALTGAGLEGLLRVVAVVASLWLWSTSLGLYIGMRIRDPSSIIRAANLVITCLTVFPPVYYPIEMLPPWIHPALLPLPTVSAAILLRSIYESPPYLDVAAAVLALHLAASLLLLVKVFRLSED